MITDTVTQQFKQQVCDNIRLLEEGKNRFRVFTPFRFDDGDHLSIVLKQENNQWVISDEGHTFMHLSYWIDSSDLNSGSRKQLIDYALNEFQIQDRYGELLVPIHKSDEYGNAFYRFIQALLKISDVNYLSRERIKSTFYEDFKKLITQNFSQDQYSFDWFDKEHDSDEFYKVDCRINNSEQQFYIYAISNDNQVKDTTISLFQFEKWNHDFQPVAIFQDEKLLSKKGIKKLSKVCNKTFTKLLNHEQEIIHYLKN
ncbi:DUF1828 domain-containing protein [Crocosphaera sp.]|uniref:DUF1828 domain-containing protein n=1 Tax=Crocosphaera sp. TaxID=2729996 RepID=UPI002618F7FC|nr:DUF1828 domain-containing protein [Crocosphaera sp.]MDJ0578550.1 DUF1828 domain-containing protein [Crocosphaera sp.]